MSAAGATLAELMVRLGHSTPTDTAPSVAGARTGRAGVADTRYRGCLLHRLWTDAVRCWCHRPGNAGSARCVLGALMIKAIPAAVREIRDQYA